jgi:hypothetical protein
MKNEKNLYVQTMEKGIKKIKNDEKIKHKRSDRMNEFNEFNRAYL